MVAPKLNKVLYSELNWTCITCYDNCKIFTALVHTKMCTQLGQKCKELWRVDFSRKGVMYSYKCCCIKIAPHFMEGASVSSSVLSCFFVFPSQVLFPHFCAGRLPCNTNGVPGQVWGAGGDCRRWGNNRRYPLRCYISLCVARRRSKYWHYSVVTVV